MLGITFLGGQQAKALGIDAGVLVLTVRKSTNNLGSLVVCVRCCSLYAVECPSLSRKHGRGHWLISTQVLAALADAAPQLWRASALLGRQTAP